MTRDLAAYGVAFAGLGGPGSPEPPPAWPRWTVIQEVGPADDSPGLDVWDSRARIGIPSVGEFRLDRAARRIELCVTKPWSPEAVLHPGLAPAASVIAHWMGRATLHAAAVLIDGRVWGLLGDKGAGKSTTAARLVGLGCDLMTDDLLVVDGVDAFAGPGAVDLREDVGPTLGGQPLGVIGTRERWRAPMPIRAVSARLAGWVDLRWSQGGVTCERLETAARLQVLDRATTLPPRAPQLLHLADLPMVEFARGYPVDGSPGGVARLFELLRDR